MVHKQRVMSRKNVLITGTSQGIGLATAKRFIKEEGYTVYGFDKQPCPEELARNGKYAHFDISVTDPEEFVVLEAMDYVICNAGIQTAPEVGEVMLTNFWGVDNIIKTYALQNLCKSVVIVGSVSGITGAEFDEYVASKGALVPYTKYIANYMSKWGGICNCIAPGGVLTELNKPVMEDKELWNKIMDLTPLKRWAEPEEIADWIYFLSTQRFCTGQTIVVDGGESIKTNFVWPS